MSISKIQIISNAFVLLGGNTIANLDEKSAEARIASSLYDTTYEALLTQFRWRFTVKQKQMARLSAKPIYGFSSSFQLPTDLIYLVKLNPSINYQVYGDILHTNANDIILDYQYKVEEHSLPAYFIKALEYTLAHQFAIPLTGDIDKASYYKQMSREEAIRAKGLDRASVPSESITLDTYANSRY